MTSGLRRELQVNDTTVLNQIQDVVRLQVETSYDDLQDRGITSYSLDQIEDDSLKLSIVFNEPNNVSNYILDPDTLRIEIV